MKTKFKVIIQARMGSSRLPGKVMKKVLNKPLIGYLIERLERAQFLEDIIVATSLKPKDDLICDYLKTTKAEIFRGSEKDVLDRYYQAARLYGAEVIVRITADCPLILPELVDRACKVFIEKKPDYLGYCLPYPEGLADISLCSFKALKIAWEKANLPSEREHIFTYLTKNPHKFHLLKLQLESSINDYRYTIDEEVDLEVVEKIIEDLYNVNKAFGLKEIENYSKLHPEIVNTNKHILRNQGYCKSLAEDEAFKDKKGGGLHYGKVKKY